MIMNKYNKYEKLHERDQQTIESFDQVYRKSLQGASIDKNEKDFPCSNFPLSVNETKIECFL